MASKTESVETTQQYQSEQGQAPDSHSQFAQAGHEARQDMAVETLRGNYDSGLPTDYCVGKAAEKMAESETSSGDK